MSKTIAGAIVDVAIAQGASSSATAKTVSEALDLLNDTLAGSSQAECKNIADAIAAVGENIPEGTD